MRVGDLWWMGGLAAFVACFIILSEVMGWLAEKGECQYEYHDLYIDLDCPKCGGRSK